VVKKARVEHPYAIADDRGPGPGGPAVVFRVDDLGLLNPQPRLGCQSG
jgi:hypothetical protein